MDRLTAALLIAIAALVMTGGAGRDVLAGEALLRQPVETVQPPAFPATPALPQRSGRVLSLLLTLEALRDAPAVLDRSNV
jgi:hypothetical protein